MAVLVVAASGITVPTVPDEIGYLSIAKFIASGEYFAMGGAAFYYFGQGLLQAPLFLVCENNECVYSAAIVLSCLWTALSIPTLVKTAGQLGYAEEGWLLPAVAALAILAPSYFYSNFLVWPEASFRLLFLVSVYLVFRASQERSIVWWGVFAVSVVGLYALHPRALGLLAVGASLPLLAAMIHGDRKGILPVIAILALGFVGVEQANEHFLGHIWQRDSSRGVIDLVSRLVTLVGMKRAILAAMGQVWYQIVASFGLIAIGVIALAQRAYFDQSRRLGCLYIAGACAAVGAASVAQMVGFSRVDHIIYGRYVDGVTPILLFVGLLAAMRLRGLGLVVALLGIAISALFLLRPGIGENLAGLVDPNVPALLWARAIGLPIQLNVLMLAGAVLACVGALLLFTARNRGWFLFAIALVWVPMDFAVYLRAVGNEEGRQAYIERSAGVYALADGADIIVDPSAGLDGHTLIDQFGINKSIVPRDLASHPLSGTEAAVVGSSFDVEPYDALGELPNGTTLIRAP